MRCLNFIRNMKINLMRVAEPFLVKVNSTGEARMVYYALFANGYRFAGDLTDVEDFLVRYPNNEFPFVWVGSYKEKKIGVRTYCHEDVMVLNIWDFNRFINDIDNTPKPLVTLPKSERYKLVYNSNNVLLTYIVSPPLWIDPKNPVTPNTLISCITYKQDGGLIVDYFKLSDIESFELIK
jgi:hypothetical protein